MEIIDKVATKMGVVPKLRPAIRVPDGGVDKNGNPRMVVKSTGAHKITILEEPKIIAGKSFEGKAQNQFKFIVEENGTKFRWMVPLTNKEGEPNYLIERLVELKIEVGDVLIVEVKKAGVNNYTEIRRENEESVAPDEGVGEDFEEDEQDELGRALAEEGQATLMCQACTDGVAAGGKHNKNCKQYVPF